MNLRDDWQEKREKRENERGGERSHATTRMCLRDAQPLSMDYRDQIVHSFVENRIMQAAK